MPKLQNVLKAMEPAVFIGAALVAVVTFIATLSVVAGLHKAIQRLSQLNIILAGLMLLSVSVPSIATFFWISVFGGTGLYLEATQGGFAGPIEDNASLALHTMLGYLPWPRVASPPLCCWPAGSIH